MWWGFMNGKKKNEDKWMLTIYHNRLQSCPDALRRLATRRGAATGALACYGFTIGQPAASQPSGSMRSLERPLSAAS